MGFANAASKQGISLEKSSKRSFTLIILFKKTKRRVFVSNLDEVTKLKITKKRLVVIQKKKIGDKRKFCKRKKVKLNIMSIKNVGKIINAKLKTKPS